MKINQFYCAVLTDITQRLYDLLDHPLQKMGYQLVSADYFPGKNSIVRLTIESASGRTGIDDCARISEYANRILDVEDLIEHSFNLEVSTPGINRKLKTPRDFKLSIGKDVLIVVDRSHDLEQNQDSHQENGTNQNNTKSSLTTNIRGTLDEFDGEKLYIQCKDEVLVVSIGDVLKARLDPQELRR